MEAIWPAKPKIFTIGPLQEIATGFRSKKKKFSAKLKGQIVGRRRAIKCRQAESKLRESAMDREAWCAAVYRVAKSQARLSN